MGSFGQTLKSRLYLSAVRTLLRRLGVAHALAAIDSLRSLGYRLRFRVHPEGCAVARVGDWTARFVVSSHLELRQVKTLGGESKILRRLLKEVRSGDVAYDIGSNVGLYTVFLAKAVGESGCVIGFEPELRSYRRCVENVRLNALANVRLFNCGLGNEEKQVDLIVDESPASGVHRVLDRDGVRAGSGLQRARLVVGDHFIDAHALPVPNIIKIDVEGMEMEVLLGLGETLRRPACRLICCEVHFTILERSGKKDAAKKILELLREAGFDRVEWLDRSHFLAVKVGSSHKA